MAKARKKKGLPADLQRSSYSAWVEPDAKPEAAAKVKTKKSGWRHKTRLKAQPCRGDAGPGFADKGTLPLPRLDLLEPRKK